MFKSIKNFFSKQQQEAPQESIEVVEAAEEDEKEYNRDPVIEMTQEDIQPILDLLTQNKQIKNMVGELRLQYLGQEQKYRDKINENNGTIDETIKALRTIYNVDPDVDYELSFSEEEGGLPSFRKL